jgi:Flp pilus assembly pilin Flp
MGLHALKIARLPNGVVQRKNGACAAPQPDSLTQFPAPSRGNNSEAFQRLTGYYFLWTRKGFVMSSRFIRTSANFLRREDGPTAVEYAAMLGILVVGCVAVMLLKGTMDHTFTVNLGGRTYGSRVAHGIASRDTKSGADYSLEQGHGSTVPVGWEGGTFEPTKDQTDVSNSRGQAAENMTEGEARQALVGLLKAYPKLFPVTKATIRTAPIVRHDDHIQIERFHCKLAARSFVYGSLSTGRGQVGDEKDEASYSGRFYQDENGAWTGRITK